MIRALPSIWRARLLIVLAVAGVYLPSLQVPFVFDDHHSITDNPAVTDASVGAHDLWRAARESPIDSRPFAYVTFALNWALDGLLGFHLVNLVIHCLMALLVLSFLRVVLGSSRSTRAGPADAAALLATLLWALSPIHVQAVTYVVQRMTSLAALAMMGALLLVMRSWRDPGRGALIGAALLTLVAIGTKEIAVLIPPLVLLCRWTVHDGGDWRRTARWRSGIAGTVIAMFGIGVAILWLRGGWRLLDVIRTPNPFESIPVPDRLLTYPRLVWHYASLLIWPSPGRLNIDPEFTPSAGLLDPPTTAVAAALLATVVVAAILRARRHPSLTLAVLWFAGTLIPEHTVLQLTMFYDHHAYLPAVGFFIPAALGIRRALVARPAVARAVVALAVVAITVSGIWTVRRNLVWRDPVKLWTLSSERSPDKWRPQLILGYTLAERMRMREAESAYREAYRRAPRLLAAVDALADILISQGRLGDAEALYREATKTVNDRYAAWLMIAYVRQRASDSPGVIEALRHVEDLVPDVPEIPHLIGLEQARSGDLAAAAASLRRAIALAPGRSRAWIDLTRVLREAGRTGDADEAAARARALGPPSGEPALSLIEIRKSLERRLRSRTLTSDRQAGRAEPAHR